MFFFVCFFTAALLHHIEIFYMFKIVFLHQFIQFFLSNLAKHIFGKDGRQPMGPAEQAVTSLPFINRMKTYSLPYDYCKHSANHFITPNKAVESEAVDFPLVPIWCRTKVMGADCIAMATQLSCHNVGGKDHV